MPTIHLLLSNSINHGAFAGTIWAGKNPESFDLSGQGLFGFEKG